MEDQKDELQKFEENAHKLSETLSEVRAIQQTQKITINQGTVSLVVGLIGIAAIMYAVFAVREANNNAENATKLAEVEASAREKVHAAELREAETRFQQAISDMAQIRGRLTNAEQFTAAHERRLNKLENPTNDARSTTPAQR